MADRAGTKKLENWRAGKENNFVKPPEEIGEKYLVALAFNYTMTLLGSSRMMKKTEHIHVVKLKEETHNDFLYRGVSQARHFNINNSAWILGVCLWNLVLGYYNSEGGNDVVCHFLEEERRSLKDALMKHGDDFSSFPPAILLDGRHWFRKSDTETFPHKEIFRWEISMPHRSGAGRDGGHYLGYIGRHCMKLLLHAMNILWRTMDEVDVQPPNIPLSQYFFKALRIHDRQNTTDFLPMK